MKKIFFSFLILFTCFDFTNINAQDTYYQNPAYNMNSCDNNMPVGDAVYTMFGDLEVFNSGNGNGGGHNDHGNGNGNGHEDHGNGHGYGHDGKPTASLPIGDGVYPLLSFLGIFALFVELRILKNKPKLAE